MHISHERPHMFFVAFTKVMPMVGAIVMSVATLLYGLTFGAEAVSPDADVVSRLVDGGASFLLLSVAGASIYALIQGRIVPIASFEKRLEAMEDKIDRIEKAVTK